MTHHAQAEHANASKVSPCGRASLRIVPSSTPGEPTNSGLARIDAAARIRVFEAGNTLFDQGDAFSGLYRVVSGLIGIRIIDENGHLNLLSFAKPGDIVGYGPLLLGGSHQTDAVALQISRVAHIDPAAGRALVRDHADVSSTLLRQSARDLADLQQKHLRMLTQEAHARLAGLLLSLVDDCRPRHEANGCSYVLPLARQDLAEFIGIRAETLSRAVRHLRELGVAQVNGREVSIPSLTRLREVSEPEGQLAFAV